MAAGILLFAADDDIESICLTLASGGLPNELVVVKGEEEFRTALDARQFQVVIAGVSGASTAPALPVLLATAQADGSGVVLIADSFDDPTLEACGGRPLVVLRRWGPAHLLRSVEQALAGAKLGPAHPLQRQEASGVLVAGLAHDLNNLLTAVLSNAAFALSKLDEQHPARPAVSQIEVAGARAVELVDRLSARGRKRRTGASPVDLERVVREAIGLLQVWMKPKNRIHASFVPGLPLLLGDVVELHQLVMNLGTNAIRAIEHGGSVHVRLERSVVTTGLETRFGELSAGTYVRLVVEDSGTGMDAESLQRIFVPFFTTKQSGSGLGLAVVAGIVRNHGGGIIVRSQPGSGTTFEIYLPAT
jgi:signal transduction histidine kinase